MIENAWVLREGFVPGDVKHRDAQTSLIEDALTPVVEGEQGSNVFLFGSTGTGKTTVAKYMLEELGRRALGIRYHHVNCWLHSSRYEVVYRVTEAITEAVDLHRSSTPRDELLDCLGRVDDQVVVVLDDVDRIEAPEALFDLYHVPGVTLVLIANSETELFADMPDRVVSRLRTGYRAEFDPYTVDQLVSILEPRVERGLVPGAIDDGNVRWIAREAAGDARVAIATLRTAARMADSRDLDRITDDVIEEAIPRANDELGERALRELDAHRRALYDLIEDHGGIQPKRLYAEYADDFGEDARSRRTVQKYLNEMKRYGLVRDEGASQERRYYVDGGVRSEGSKA